MNYWKVNKFTKDELNRVDQDKFRNELYVLNHSPAARDIFSHVQVLLTVDEGEYLDDVFELLGCLTLIAIDMSHIHHIAYYKYNPNRKMIPNIYGFMQLIKELGYNKKYDEDQDEDLVCTISGWRVI